MTTTDPRPATAAASPKSDSPGGTKPQPAPSVPTSRPAVEPPAPMSAPPGGTEVPPTPEIETSRPASVPSTPIDATPGGDKLTRDHETRDDHRRPVAGDQHADRHSESDAQQWSAVGAQLAGGHRPCDNQRLIAAGRTPDPAAEISPTPNRVTLLDPTLALAADVLDDIERIRTAHENRLRQMTRSVEDSDGKKRGFGYDETHPDVARFGAMVAMMLCDSKVLLIELGWPKKPQGNGCCLEHDAIRHLNRKVRAHPLGPWMKAQIGIGEKQGARLLGAIGDPYWRPQINQADGTVLPAGPRTVSALWAYCGLDPRDGAARRRKRGEKANWSTKGKTKAHLIAKSCIRQARSPYRAVYDARREHTAGTHPDWTLGHSHADALHVVSKEILKHLWREAKRLHQTSADQPDPVAHVTGVGGANVSPAKSHPVPTLRALGTPMPGAVVAA